MALGAPPAEGYWRAGSPASPPRDAIGWLLRRSGRALRGAGVQVPAGRRLLSVAPTARSARGELGGGVSLPLRPEALGLPLGWCVGVTGSPALGTKDTSPSVQYKELCILDLVAVQTLLSISHVYFVLNKATQVTSLVDPA